MIIFLPLVIFVIAVVIGLIFRHYRIVTPNFFGSFVLVMLTVLLTYYSTAFYNWYISKPDIKGQIYRVIIGEMPNPDNPNEMLTSFLVYLHLTNMSKHSVHILDYEMEVGIDGGHEKVTRLYGMHNAKDWKFFSKTHSMDLGDFGEKLICRKYKPVEYGAPLDGFVVFLSKQPKSYFVDKFENLKYKLTCIDVFGCRHEINSTAKQFINLPLLQEIADIKLIPKEKLKSTSFKCSKCGFEHAQIEKNVDGSSKLIVNKPGLQLIVIDKESDKGVLKCPKCGNEDSVNLELFRKF